MEKGTPRDEVMLQFVQEARNGASHDEITAKIKEHYFPVEVEPDPVAHIRVNREEAGCQLFDRVEQADVHHFFALKESFMQTADWMRNKGV